MARLVSGEASEEHRRFEEVCQEMGLPRNESKRLAGRHPPGRRAEVTRRDLHPAALKDEAKHRNGFGFAVYEEMAKARDSRSHWAPRFRRSLQKTIAGSNEPSFPSLP